ncbi:MAG: hypothetical protein SOV46_05825, partial [Candidatus Faecousia sp.]|nr:hypothetical protein [Candidatus Faecousia sp.]
CIFGISVVHLLRYEKAMTGLSDADPAAAERARLLQAPAAVPRAFPRELPPEGFSGRAGLCRYPQKVRLQANCGWYRGSMVFRPLWDGGLFSFEFFE